MDGMTDDERRAVFGDFDPAQYEQEARQRWGDTEAYQGSTRRAAGYTRADWEKIRRGGDEVNRAGPGLAHYMSEAIAASVRRRG